MPSSRRVELNFGGYLSQDRYSQIVDLQNCLSLSMQVAWSLFGAPKGKFVFEVSNHGDSSGRWDPVDTGVSDDLQPGGAESDGMLTFDNVKTSALYGRWHYVWESGGTGCAPYDGASPLKPPVMVVRE